MVFGNKSSIEGDTFPPEVQALLAKYRDAVQVPEAGSDFMPRLWERIDSQQRVTYSFRRMTSGFVTAAAAICLMFTAVMWSPMPSMRSTPQDGGTYVDVLVDDTPATDDVSDSPVSI